MPKRRLAVKKKVSWSSEFISLLIYCFHLLFIINALAHNNHALLIRWPKPLHHTVSKCRRSYDDCMFHNCNLRAQSEISSHFETESRKFSSLCSDTVQTLRLMHARGICLGNIYLRSHDYLVIGLVSYRINKAPMLKKVMGRIILITRGIINFQTFLTIQ